MKKLYPLARLKLNRMGHLHAWTFGAKLKDDSTLYVQQDTDVESCLANLTQKERDNLQAGFMIRTYNFPEAYFQWR